MRDPTEHKAGLHISTLTEPFCRDRNWCFDLQPNRFRTMRNVAKQVIIPLEAGRATPALGPSLLPSAQLTSSVYASVRDTFACREALEAFGESLARLGLHQTKASLAAPNRSQSFNRRAESLSASWERLRQSANRSSDRLVRPTRKRSAPERAWKETPVKTCLLRQLGGLACICVTLGTIRDKLRLR